MRHKNSVVITPATKDRNRCRWKILG